MVKNLNETFIIKIFFIALLSVLLSNASPSSSSKNVSESPKARVLLRCHHTNHNDVNETVISDSPDTTIVLEEASIINCSLYLECSAKYPVEIIYKGDGYPDTLSFAETRRNFSELKDPSTYRFFAGLHLMRIRESNTGNYICRQVGNNFNSVHYYIFVPGEDIFLEHIRPNVRAKENDETVIIPCRVTDPNVDVYLGKYNTNAGLKQYYANNSSLKYDPSTGFTMEIRKFEHPWGLYICNTNKDTRAFKSLLLPPIEIKVSPPGRLVPLQENVTVKFRCEAKEKILMHISGNYVPTVRYERNDSALLPFIAHTEITKPENFDNHTIITCTAINGNRELHHWEYTTYGERNIRFSYDYESKSFLCCTDAFQTPEMYLVPMCSSSMECQIQKHCAKTGKYPCIQMPNSTVQSSSGCSAFPAPTEHTEGMIVCSVGDSDDDENREQREFYFSFPTEGKPILDFSSNVPTEDVLKITKFHEGPIFVNEEVEVFCTANRFFFSKGHVWAFQRNDSTIELVDKALVKETLVPNIGLLSSIPTRIPTITFPHTDIKALICYAPVWSSATDWRNVSIPITVISE